MDRFKEIQYESHCEEAAREEQNLLDELAAWAFRGKTMKADKGRSAALPGRSWKRSSSSVSLKLTVTAFFLLHHPTAAVSILTAPRPWPRKRLLRFPLRLRHDPPAGRHGKRDL